MENNILNASRVGLFDFDLSDELFLDMKNVPKYDKKQNKTAHHREFAIDFSPLSMTNKIELGAINPIDPQILILLYSRSSFFRELL